ncbi:hypothetical protein KI387_002752, partial [Taxus chinensis]
MDYNAGTKVEVCTNEEGYRGAWFEGTVVSYKGGGIHKVEHENFENERKEPLKEDFHFTQIRPRPPKIKTKNWKVDNPVEIYDCHCWWRGIVSEVLPAGYYRVYFPEYGEKVYHMLAMRTRREWRNGKWSRPGCWPLPQRDIERQLDSVVQAPPVKRVRIRVKGPSESAGPSGVPTPKMSGVDIPSCSTGKSLEVSEKFSDLQSRVAALENIVGVMQRQLNALL